MNEVRCVKFTSHKVRLINQDTAIWRLLVRMVRTQLGKNGLWNTAYRTSLKRAYAFTLVNRPSGRQDGQMSGAAKVRKASPHPKKRGKPGYSKSEKR